MRDLVGGFGVSVCHSRWLIPPLVRNLFIIELVKLVLGKYNASIKELIKLG